MVVAPMLKGGRIENRWQPTSAATWCGPSSFSMSFIAAKIGRSGHPTQKPGGRGGTTLASAFTFSCAKHRSRIRDRRVIAQKGRRMRREEGAQPRDHHRRRVFAAHRQGVLAGHFRLHVATAQERVQRLFEIVGG